MGGGDRRDRKDRSGEYSNREPGDDDESDAQRRLSNISGSGRASEEDIEVSEYASRVQSQAESARKLTNNPGKYLQELPETIDRSVLDHHITNTQDGRHLNACLQGWLTTEQGHSNETVISPAGEASDGFQDVGFWWDKEGYRSKGVEPLWKAADNAIDRETEWGEMQEISVPGQNVEYSDDVTEVGESIIGFSQAFAAEHLSDENSEITVHRMWQGEKAEEARAAKNSNEGFEVNPRTLQSTTLSFNKLHEDAEEGNPIVSRTIDIKDVGIYTAAVAPGHAETEEITMLGHERYTVPPDQITIVDNNGYDGE